MQITGLPSSIAAGQTVCITVTGVSGPVTTGQRGTINVLSVIQSPSRPNEWIVCFTVGLGVGAIDVSADGKVKTLAVRGR